MIEPISSIESYHEQVNLIKGLKFSERCNKSPPETHQNDF